MIVTYPPPYPITGDSKRAGPPARGMIAAAGAQLAPSNHIRKLTKNTHFDERSWLWLWISGSGCLCAAGCWSAMLGLGLAVMRGERERPRVHMAYWLLAALYAFAMFSRR
eukprot:COSAG02_NODE_49_length_45106_cov_298.436177_16_plen_110_part_00